MALKPGTTPAKGEVVSSGGAEGVHVHGLDVDAQTRCAHYHGATDIVALRFKCCDSWYPCIDCHTALADHVAQIWPMSERDVEAVLCGACGHRLTVTAYLECGSRCPACQASFNPGCRNHHHLYFEMDAPGIENRG